MRCLHMDQDGEFTSGDLNNYCAQMGVCLAHHTVLTIAEQHSGAS
jgi:hypothetical protein